MRLIGPKGFFPFAGALLLSGALVTANAQTQTQSPQRPSAKELHNAAGDIATDPGPVDTSLSPKLTRADVRKAMKKVADWSVINEQSHFTQDWTYAPPVILLPRRRRWVTSGITMQCCRPRRSSTGSCCRGGTIMRTIRRSGRHTRNCTRRIRTRCALRRCATTSCW